MTSRDFCYWLQGYFEINAAKFDNSRSFPDAALNDNQINNIRKHLDLVFKHEIDPSYQEPVKPSTHNQSLHDIHNGVGSLPAQPHNGLPPYPTNPLDPKERC